MSIQSFINATRQYFFTPEGELTPKGTETIVDSALSAVGTVTLVVAGYLWSRCSAERAPGPDRSERMGHGTRLLTSCTQKLGNGISFVANKSWEITAYLANKSRDCINNPTPANLSAICVAGLLISSLFRNSADCTAACNTVECCVGSTIQVATTGALVAIVGCSTLKVLNKIVDQLVENNRVITIFKHGLVFFGTREVAKIIVDIFVPSLKEKPYVVPLLGGTLYAIDQIFFAANEAPARRLGRPLVRAYNEAPPMRPGRPLLHRAATL